MGDQANYPYIQQFRLGETTVSILATSYLLLDLAQEMSKPWPNLAPEWQERCAKPSIVPAQCIHIQTSDISLLIDTGDSDTFIGTEYEQHEIPAPPTLIEQLAKIGIKPNEITHVVFTHHHFDHISSATVLRDGEFVPAFPKAIYYLGQADWQSVTVQQSVKDPSSLINHTLGVLEQYKKLTFIENDLKINAQIQVIATPGESPGHQMIRLQAGEHVIYFVGDLYHDPVELAYPEWMVDREDLAELQRSRKTFIEQALSENATFVASHIFGVRRLLSPFETETIDLATIAS
jgi:glyoxylase-like metal-dependent hydrolase (beta-lactamase superfamily II)